MKAVNVIIILLIVAVGLASYQLIIKVLPQNSNPIALLSPAGSAKSAPAPDAAPAPPGVQRPAPETPVSPATPPPLISNEKPAAQLPPAPVPPVKEEPKLRPVRDIKVVLYLTDW